MNIELNPIDKLKKDIKEAAKVLSDDEARFLVDSYYQMQDNRIRSDGQIRSMDKSGEPNQVLGWLSDQNTTLENNIKSALDKYTDSKPIGVWMKSICGIGAVISAGFLAHIDITRAPTAGHIWSYAGLNPDMEWKKGEKRPFNATLKTLCWKLGESFVKVSNNGKDIYGKMYQNRKQQDI